MRNWKPYLLLLALTSGILGCGNNPSSSSSSPPTPSLSSISPSSASAGSSSFTITATGSNFIAPSGGQCGSEICFDHRLLPTDSVSATELRATVPSTLIRSPGSLPVFIVSNCEVPSNTLTFTVGGAVTCSAAGVLQRASVPNSGGQSAGNSDSPNISGNGRFAFFDTPASDLVTGDTNGADDVFMRDTCLGVTSGCTPSTVRISVPDPTTGNTEAMGPLGFGSLGPNSSDDGRYVVFRSTATNLVVSDTNGVEDIFVRDTVMGTTTRVSLPDPSTVDTEAMGGDSFDAFISDDGRFVVFASDATNLVTGDTNGLTDIFLRDTCVGGPGGCTPTTARISVDSNEAEAVGGGSFESHISGDGRFIVFQSEATNLDLAIPDLNGTSDVFLRDTLMGTTIRLSISTGGVEGDGFSEEAFVSDDGRFVSFGSFSNNFVTPVETDGDSDIFLRDTCIGATSCTPSTTAMSVSTGGTLGNATSFSGRISPDGRFVVYDSGADNLVSSDTNGTFDVFVRDRMLNTTTILSVDSAGVLGNGFSNDPFISDDGRFVVLRSDASNLVSGDTNGTGDIFIAQNCF